jgi:hypothetical protein
MEYRNIVLPCGNTLQIKFDVEGVVYDLFDKDGEHKEAYGYDLYEEIPNIVNLDPIEE